MQNDMPMTTHRLKSKPEIDFRYGMPAVSFLKPEVVLSQLWIEVSHRNLAYRH